MKALHTSIVIHVSNLNNAVKYYTDILGFTFDFKFGDYIGLFNGEASIHLSGPDHQGTKKQPGTAHLVIECEEIDNYYNFLLSNKALITVPIEDRDYGVRDFSVNDRDGNTIVFGKSIN